MKLSKRLPFFVLAFSLSLTVSNSFGKGCVLDWDKVYYKDLDGNMEYNFKTKKMEREYRTYKYYQGDFPQQVSLNIPYSGDCSKIEFREIQSYRNIGPRSFEGGEEEHDRHSLEPKKMAYEKKPFESFKPQSKVGKKVIVLSSFKVYEALSTIDFKKYHPWNIRYEVFYKDAAGLDNKKELTVDLKLTH